MFLFSLLAYYSKGCTDLGHLAFPNKRPRLCYLPNEPERCRESEGRESGAERGRERERERRETEREREREREKGDRERERERDREF